jgi:hypothetical protein
MAERLSGCLQHGICEFELSVQMRRCWQGTKRPCAALPVAVRVKSRRAKKVGPPQEMPPDHRTKATPGITGLCGLRVPIDAHVWHLDVGSSRPVAEGGHQGQIDRETRAQHLSTFQQMTLHTNCAKVRAETKVGRNDPGGWMAWQSILFSRADGWMSLHHIYNTEYLPVRVDSSAPLCLWRCFMPPRDLHDVEMHGAGLGGWFT